MGTRNLTCVMDGGKYKIAQYGQWDGYPSGQGKTILEFLSSDEFDKSKLIEALNGSRFLEENEHTKLYADLGIDVEGDYISMEDSNKFKEAYPQLSRDMGGDIIQFVQRSGGTILKDSIDFANDSLFCEYAYVVDLDKGTFEIFEGFQKTPTEEGSRFFGGEYDCSDDTKYYSVKAIKSYQLDDLPTVEAFIAELEPEDDV